MDALLGKLANWIKVIQVALLGTIIIEAILVILIGVASNQVENKYWVGILIGCGILYIFLLSIKAAYHSKFPGSIVDELLAKKRLEEMNKLFDRQKAINEYINHSIQGLNTQTCVINYVQDKDHLCDKELEIGLAELLEPLLSYTDVILDSSTEKKYTIGVYLGAYQKFPKYLNEIELVEEDGEFDFNDWAPISDKGILILKDELGLKALLPKNLLEETAINASYEIQTAIKRTLNNRTFTTHGFLINGEPFGIICSEILEFCSDDYADGVLFIIHKAPLSFPSDVSEVLGIFNRVASNYISKYNSCIIEEVKSKIKNGHTV